MNMNLGPLMLHCAAENLEINFISLDLIVRTAGASCRLEDQLLVSILMIAVNLKEQKSMTMRVLCSLYCFCH